MLFVRVMRLLAIGINVVDFVLKSIVIVLGCDSLGVRTVNCLNVGTGYPLEL
jgi:hypothetical protein